MNNIAKFSVKKPITVIMCVLVIVLLGVISLTNLKTDLFPSMNLPYAVVSTQYIGASPEEVELVVTKPIEQAMATVSGIKDISSISNENVSMLILEFNDGIDMDSAIVDMRESLSMTLSYMPDEVGNPMIMKLNPDMMPVMQISIGIDGLDKKDTSEILKDEIVPRLERTPGVSVITSYGLADNVINIKLSDEKIDELNEVYRNQIQIDYEMIKGIIAGQNFNMPVGYSEKDDSTYLVRVGDKYKALEDISKISIMKNDFMDITLEDIADVSIVSDNEEVYTKVNGEEAIIFSVQKQNSFVTTDVVNNLNKELELIEQDYEGLEVTLLMDQAEYIDQAVGSVLNNLLYGAALAIIVLLLFLRDLKPTIIVGLAIPISVLFAFVMIYFYGITLNIISMGGLALGIGMLVDNSIVVIENIYRLRSEGKSMFDAAKDGATQIAGAITASTLTTVAVFIPVIFLEGITADLLTELALTITFSLVASLVIALSLVPMMASKMIDKENKKEAKFMDSFKKGYEKVLKFSLKHRILVLITVIGIFIGSGYLVFTGGMEFMPEGQSNQLNVSVDIEEELTFNEKTEILDDTMNKILNVEGVETVAAYAGIDNVMMSLFSSDELQLSVILDDESNRSYKEISDDVKEIKLDKEDINYEILLSSSGGNMAALTGAGVSIEVNGNDLDELKKVTEEITKIVEENEGTTNVTNSLNNNQPEEIKIIVDKDKAIEYGLTTVQVYMTVSDEINEDYNASKITVNNSTYDINVYPKESNVKSYGLEEIEDIQIESMMGVIVKVKDIASVEYGTGFASINRKNQNRYMEVTGDIEEGHNVTLVNDEIKEKIDNLELAKGMDIVYGGESAEINDSMNALFYAILIGIILVYMIMAAQFENLLSPFIVMFTIPLAFTGSFLALIVTGTSLSVVGLIGLVILTGVVVNNGIVLIDYINHLMKEENMKVKEAVVEAGKTRLRPIIMTALTTILALSTMAVGIGEGSEMMQPMAITTIGGLLYATLLTLIVVPVIVTLFRRDKKVKNEKRSNT